MTTITPFIWFEGRIDEAVELYRSLFPDTVVLESSRYPDGMPGVGGQLMSVTVDLLGNRLMLFNGGPHITLNPAFSLMVVVDDQAEVDRLWDALVEGGEPSQCGWLIDRFGLSWQIVPRQLAPLMASTEPGVSARVVQAMLGMVKLDIAALEAAARG